MHPREYFGSWNRTYGDWRNTETGSDRHTAVKERGRGGALTLRHLHLAILMVMRRASFARQQICGGSTTRLVLSSAKLRLINKRLSQQRMAISQSCT
jgi:hypothetical protein